MSFHHTPQHSFRPVVEKAMHYLAINDGINWTQPNIDNWDASEKQPIRLQWSSYDKKELVDCSCEIRILPAWRYIDRSPIYNVMVKGKRGFLHDSIVVERQRAGGLDDAVNEALYECVFALSTLTKLVIPQGTKIKMSIKY